MSLKNNEDDIPVSNNSDIEISNIVETEFSRLTASEQDDIKKIVCQTFSENLSLSDCFFSLNERLDYILGMDTMKFVKKIVKYYKPNKQSYKKRAKNNAEVIIKAPVDLPPRGREVIFNEIPESIDEDKLREFCSQFGEIELIKRLNNIKYLIRFKYKSSAEAAVDYRGPIQGKFLKKYLNNFTDVSHTAGAGKENAKGLNQTKTLNSEANFFENILKYLRQQDVIVDTLYIKGEIEIANELNETKNEIKRLVLRRSKN
ncbi:hypothetical protein CDIK_0794 [Cucumispora dikerogammari]|nr:hypothetical protein CDIK_0794 [Cucumispora dikerogammari]